ncbi:MAG: hypothetical protein ACRC62_21505 [Microcoleus sp.]
MLKLIDVVVEQDAMILSKIFANIPQRIKLNNEMGMDWVRRNFANFLTVVEPNLSLRDRPNKSEVAIPVRHFF